jgi:hypothetical protein
MRRGTLIWFQLRFPRDLTAEAVLAALSSLSGIPHGVRLVFDLSADSSGISHRLGVSPSAVETVTGSLRAAVPSLRLDSIEPRTPGNRRSLWQLSAPVAVIRTDDLAAISASLLSALFPLSEGEAICLRWSLHSAPRPPLPDPPDSHMDGRLRALRAKLALPGLAGTGELFVKASDRGRASQLAGRVAVVLRSLATPHGNLSADPYWYGLAAHLLLRRGRYLSAAELAAVIGWPVGGADLPGLELGAAKRLPPSAGLKPWGRVLGTTDFAGVEQQVAISVPASTRGLYVLGPTGTGKTSLLKNLIRDDLEQGRGLVVIESNGDLITDLVDSIPPSRLDDVVLLDPTDHSYSVGFNPFASNADPSLVADQLGELFQRLWAAYWGPRTGQLAHMALLTLARRPGSTLLDLPRLFLDERFRAGVLADLDDPVGLGPDWHWFEGLPARERNTVIAPLLNKVRQFTARPSVRAIIGQASPATSMETIMAEGKVLLVNLPKGLIGAETAQLLGSLILTNVWQTAAQRAELHPSQRRPFGLYVDEIQDFAAAPVPWDEMFAQGRKYGLALSVAHQNLGQLPKELREVILANARSKAVFALSGTDARTLEPLFAPSLTAADLSALDAYSVAALVALENGTAARPVTLTTPPPPPSLGTTAAVRAASRHSFARKRSEVEATLRAQASGPQPPAAPVGRQRRRRV